MLSAGMLIVVLLLTAMLSVVTPEKGLPLYNEYRCME